ncbi:DUF2637 domain-containing protein [Nocardiopsis tropica]|uniref:DUF2637 domain-containing protein n=1 Tax=Nocardiopsis tropica TaxID=109330 RepID=A0ABU7KK88_9ACTN|nr:DUF2637 domain-containing protein [Nocardiopsis umidischolae]MEE2049701.1 DUF2637 domain-containing protein [Nocardiopsis umidischolae]
MNADISKIVVAVENLQSIILIVSSISAFAILLYPSIKLTRILFSWHRRLPGQEKANLVENTIVLFFASVTSGLIMQGLVGFAQTEMALGGPWPYLLFAALDGMAAFFAFVSYRWAKLGASALGPRVMVLLIVAGSSWFQWSHAAAAGQGLSARVAWSLMPVIAAALWETVLRHRRKQWSDTRWEGLSEPLIPGARWWWDPWGSLRIARLAAMGHITDSTEALDLYAMKVETQRRLRDALGYRWRRRVPAEVSVRLRQGLHIREAKDLTDAFLAQIERENGTAPDVDPQVFFSAVQHYVQASQADMAPSERGLCEKFGVSPKKRRWAQKVIAKGKEILEEKGTVPPALEQRNGARV